MGLVAVFSLKLFGDFGQELFSVYQSFDGASAYIGNDKISYIRYLFLKKYSSKQGAPFHPWYGGFLGNTAFNIIYENQRIPGSPVASPPGSPIPKKQKTKGGGGVRRSTARRRSTPRRSTARRSTARRRSTPRRSTARRSTARRSTARRSTARRRSSPRVRSRRGTPRSVRGIKNDMPTLRKLSYKNQKHKYKLSDPHKKRIKSLDEGIKTESRKTEKSIKKAAVSKKARLNVLRIYRRNKDPTECNKLTQDMKYIDTKYGLGKTENICSRSSSERRRTPSRGRGAKKKTKKK
jgi:hypothetical protein